MASEKKKKKAKNSSGWRGILKEKAMRMKRWLFFTPAQRKKENKETK